MRLRHTCLPAIMLPMIAGCTSTQERVIDAQVNASKSDFAISTNTAMDYLSSIEQCMKRTLAIHNPRKVGVILGDFTAVEPAESAADIYFLSALIGSGYPYVNHSTSLSYAVGRSRRGPANTGPTMQADGDVQSQMTQLGVDELYLLSSKTLVDVFITGSANGATTNGQKQKRQRYEHSNDDDVDLTEAFSAGFTGEIGQSVTLDRVEQVTILSEYSPDGVEAVDKSSISRAAVRIQTGGQNTFGVGFGDDVKLSVAFANDAETSTAMTTGVQKMLAKSSALDVVRQLYPSIDLLACYEKERPARYVANAEPTEESFLRTKPRTRAELEQYLANRGLLARYNTADVTVSDEELLKAVRRYDYLLQQVPTQTLQPVSAVASRVYQLRSTYDSSIRKYDEAANSKLNIRRDSRSGNRQLSLDVGTASWRRPRAQLVITGQNVPTRVVQQFALTSESSLIEVAVASSSPVNAIELWDGPVRIKSWSF